MFFVTGAKIYECAFDPDLRVYREVKLVRKVDGSYKIRRMTSGIPNKPARYNLCSKQELVAQFGGSIKPEKQAESKE